MATSKITLASLEQGAFHNNLNHLMHVADVSPGAREDIEKTLTETITHVMKTRDLHEGLGGEHAQAHYDEAMRFLDKQHGLDRAHADIIRSALGSHLGIQQEPEGGR